MSIPSKLTYDPGAPAADDVIPLSVPALTGREWEYIKDCLDTGWVSSVGSYVNRFEQQLADYVGLPHAVATVNGTAALHIALLVAGVQPGDEVLISTITFIAPANAIAYANAHPVFIDCEPDYWQMDVAQVAAFLHERCEVRDGTTYNRDTGRRVSAVLPVHILGHPVDMDALLPLAAQYHLAVIEDATESLGALYRGRKVGALGHIACFSFNGNKLITTGGGGMIVTANPQWAQRARYLTTQAKDDPLEYVHGAVGYNYRLVNVLAAMGVAQMEQIAAYVATKHRIARTYAEALAHIPGIMPMPQASWAESAFWLYTIRVQAETYGMDSRALLRALHERGIQTRPLWQPMHRSVVFPSAQVMGGAVADALHAEALSIPCSVGLTEAQQTRVIDAIRALHKG